MYFKKYSISINGQKMAGLKAHASNRFQIPVATVINE